MAERWFSLTAEDQRRGRPPKTAQPRYWAVGFGAVSALAGSTVAKLHLAMHNQAKQTLLPCAFAMPPSTMKVLLSIFYTIVLALFSIKVVSKKYLFKELIGGR